IKLSLLLFYRRIFPIQNFEKMVTIAAVIVILWFIPGFLGETFLCWPIDVMWTDFAHAAEKCGDYGLFFAIMISFEIVIDFLILVLPIAQVLQLQMSWNSRATLAGIFMLGGFSIVTNILRIAFSYRKGEQFIDLIQDMVWINIHCATAILCICLPTYRPL
ncbi:uncharacterized protein BDR25DRAFT_152969, partial [Lindgomyces ingoldianus]